MEKAKKEAIMNARTFDELLDAEYGKAGTPEREQFDTDLRRTPESWPHTRTARRTHRDKENLYFPP